MIDIDKIKRQLHIKYPFFGSVTAKIQYIEDPHCVDYSGRPTIGSDGENIYYNSEYIESLSEEQQLFVFAHEDCHIAFNHILRSEGKDAETWNIATDAVINAFLKKDGLKLMYDSVSIENAINFDAEELYELLMQEDEDQGGKDSSDDDSDSSESNSGGDDNKDQNPQDRNDEQNQDDDSEEEKSDSDSEDDNDDNQKSDDGQGNPDENNDSGNDDNDDDQDINNDQNNSDDNNESPDEKQDVGHDTHRMWKSAVDKHKKMNSGDEQRPEIKKQQGQTKKDGEKKTFKENDEQRKKELDELLGSLVGEALRAGTKTNMDRRQITNIGHSKPLIDWRYILKEAVNLEVDWSFENAEIEEGVITPYLEDIPTPETEIVLDTSRSVSDVLLKHFLKECKNILQNSKIKAGCFDTKFYGFNELRNEEDIEEMEFIGGGGTDFDVAVNAFSNRVENKIIFTDGNALMPEDEKDVIWIVYGQVKIKPKGGTVIYISPEDLERFYNIPLL